MPVAKPCVFGKGSEGTGGSHEAHINILLDQCRARAKSESKINLSDWFKYLTFDIIGDLSFGESFDCLEKDDFHPYISCMMGALKFILFQSATMRFLLSTSS